MDVRTKIPLKNYTTMALGGDARFMAPVSTVAEVMQIYQNAATQQLPIFILGGGSNVIARDEGFDGIVLLNRIPGFEVISDDTTTAVIKIGAGELWDDVVKRTVQMGLSGIEAMSAIPGTAGAAPVQNVGAYGQEIADTLISLEAYDSQTGRVVTLQAADCQFSYRHSIFRGREQGRYCILNITIRLSHTAPQPPFYAAVTRYFDEHHITTFTPQAVRDAVIAIRADKLPDPAKRPNTGSFFKNVLVDEWRLAELEKEYAQVPHYQMPHNKFKIPTGWLIEKAGLKGRLLYGMRVHDKNALVLINESASSYHDLAKARHEIIQTVYDTFHIQIEQEPLEI